jgi:ribose transport system permease protein
VNGLLVAKRGISPFLATLAVMIVLQGARFAYTQGAPSGSLPPGFATIATGTVLGVPISLIVLVIVAVAVALLLARTVLGRRLRLIGDNPRAAALAGIPVERSTVVAYVLCSLLATVGAFVLIGYVGIVDNWTGRGLDLDSIAAAVMGGASLKGGQGSVLGSLLGALVLVMIYNIVLLVGLSVEFQLIVKGVIIVIAAAFYLRRA